MTHSFDRKLIRNFAGKSIDELLDAPPSALKGLSENDAVRLAEAFGIKSIHDLAANRFFAWAQAIQRAANSFGFDPGPPPEWTTFFREAPLSYYVEHPSRRFRIEFGPVYYRGRLDGSARVLVVGQDPSTNEILAQRVFVGHSGQRVQGLLSKLGITRSYTMLNTFLYSVYGQFDAELRDISLQPAIIEYRHRYLDRICAHNPIEAIVTIGSGARHAIESWTGKPPSLPVFALVHPAADEAMVLNSWNKALPALRQVVGPDDDGCVDTSPYGTQFEPGDVVGIPHDDLPFGLPSWHGRQGQSCRDGNKIIIWTAP